jgi:GNAT superfamily N-acetyltransferase
MTPVTVRQRSAADLGPCAQLARAVHDADGYPHYLPDDLVSFIASSSALAAWVAERTGTIVGHVALHSRSSDQVMQAACTALGVSAEQIGVVARLLVSPRARRCGVGRLLLQAASDEAATRGLWPVLDVATDLTAAIGLYEGCGWTRAAALTVRFKDGTVLDEYVYVGPRAAG